MDMESLGPRSYDITTTVPLLFLGCIRVFLTEHRLVGLVVRASDSPTVDLSSIPAFTVDLFSGSSYTPVATPPGAWRDKVNAGSGWPCVSILRLGEIYSFYLSVAARTIV